MALYPGAYFVKIDWANKTDPKKKKRTFGKVILHTAVSNNRSLENAFKDGKLNLKLQRIYSCSHFYVDEDGNVEQYIDTKYPSAADVEGNSSSISIETWDGLKPGDDDDGANRVRWTAHQVTALAMLLKWICATHNIPVELMADSQPKTRGIGYHRLGVGKLRHPNGEKWSSDPKKVCPGDARIAQVDHVISRTKTTRAWSGRPPLRIDGSLGPKTIRRWQTIMGTPVDGVISEPSMLVKAVQRHLRSKTSYKKFAIDGYGIQQGSPRVTETVLALQEYLGAPIKDGWLAAPRSPTVNLLQSRLNKGFF